MADIDPATLTDEELDKELDGLEPEEPVVEEPKVPEKEVEEEEPVATPDPEPEDEDDPEEPKPISRRESLRIQDVLNKLKESKPDAKPKPFAGGIDYDKELDADPELKKKLDDDRTKSNEASYMQGLEQAKSLQFMTRLDIDAPRVEAKYKFLDKHDEENFNPIAANAMNQKYLQFVGYDSDTGFVQHPNIRYSDFVEAEMEFAEEIASHRIADATKSITKQAAKTGLRPDGSGAKRMNLNKAPENMTDEELDAIIAQAVPKR